MDVARIQHPWGASTEAAAERRRRFACDPPTEANENVQSRGVGLRVPVRVSTELLARLRPTPSIAVRREESIPPESGKEELGRTLSR